MINQSNDWEKYTEINSKLKELLEKQDKNPTLSGSEAICGIINELEKLNRTFKKKEELMADFEEDEDDILDYLNEKYKDFIKTDEKSIDIEFKPPAIPEFKPYI